MWNAQTGKQIHSWSGYVEPVRSLSVAPKDNRVLTTGWGNAVCLQNLETGRVLRRFEHPAVVTCVAFAPDGKSFLSGTGGEPGKGNMVHLWNLETETEVWRGQGHRQPIRSVAFSPDNEHLVASASDDGTVRTWDLETGSEVQRLEGPPTGVVAAAYLAQNLLVSAGGSALTVWDPETETRLSQIVLSVDQMSQMALDPSGLRAFVADGKAEAVAVVDLPPQYKLVKNPSEAAGEVRRYEGHGGEVHALAITPNGRILLAAGHDGQVHVYNVSSGRQMGQLRGHQGPVRAVAVCLEGRRAVTGGQDGTARLWNLQTCEELQQIKDLGEVVCLAVAPDGKQAVVTGTGPVVVLWNLENNQTTRIEHKASVNCVAFSPKGDGLILAGSDRVLHFWDRSGKEEALFKGHRLPVHAVAFSRDGRILLSGGEDATVRLWDMATRKVIQQFHGVKGSVHSVALSPDGRVALAAGMDQVIYLWDTTNGLAAEPMQGHTAPIGNVLFSPTKGTQAFSAGTGKDPSVRCWRLPSPSEFVRVPKAPPLARIPVPTAEELKPVLDKIREEYPTHVRQTAEQGTGPGQGPLREGAKQHGGSHSPVCLAL